MLDLEDEVGNAIDNVEASMGTDGFPASIRNLASKAQDCITAFNRRDEVMSKGEVIVSFRVINWRIE